MIVLVVVVVIVDIVIIIVRKVMESSFVRELGTSSKEQFLELFLGALSVKQ